MGEPDDAQACARCCSLYEATDAAGQGLRGVYVLGGLLDDKERVAIASQQTRAINLVYSLRKTGRVSPGQRVCIIGAGAAGLTAAAYAIASGIGATVLECRAPLWNLRGCRTRWLHPNLFRWWPDPRWQCTATDLPVMNWYAAYACEVGDLLLSKYQAFEHAQASWTFPRYRTLQTIGELKLEPVSDHRWRVAWDLGARGVWLEDDFDAVIVAIGFGAEARLRDTEASVYWLDDTLERENPHRPDVGYLVSGTGDGGLTDLLRIRIDGFRHHHLRDSLLDLNIVDGELCEEINAIEARVREGARHAISFDPTDRYLALARQFRFQKLLERRRPRTRVVLTNRGNTPLVSPAWPISRFLAATLLVHDDPVTSYRAGPATWTPGFPGTPSPGAPEHPSHFDVGFGGSTDVERFDAIVVRHGTKRFSDPRHGRDPVRVVDAFLIDHGMTLPQVLGAREKWYQAVLDGLETDRSICPAVTNADQTRRSRAPSVQPVIAGRTVLGMLSRLVATIGPQQEVRRPARVLSISEPLVSDTVASLLTSIGDRMPDMALPNGRGWRLGPELEHESVIEVMAAADEWLRPLWRLAPGWSEDLERTWVLPRPPWSKPGPLLRHTCVARHWRDWQLRYGRTQGRRTRRTNASIRAKLGEIHLAKDAVASERMLAVVDLCELGVRAAIFRSDGSLPRRLATELGAEILVISRKYQIIRPG